jgi:hypothetical protein
VSLSDTQLLCLLGAPPPEQQAAPPLVQEGQPRPAAVPRPPLARLLRTLALANVRGLTDAALRALCAAAGRGGSLELRHLRMEECTCEDAPRGAAAGGGGDDEAVAAGPGPPRRPSFSEAALLRLLGRCPRLLSLRLRHAAAPLGPGFVGAAVEACPLMERLLLDQCDLLQRGFALTPDAYAALSAVQVVKCCVVTADGEALHAPGHGHEHGHHHRHHHHRSDGDGAAPGGDAAAQAATAAAGGRPAAAEAADAGGGPAAGARRVGQALLTHFIQEGRTASAPMR